MPSEQSEKKHIYLGYIFWKKPYWASEVRGLGQLRTFCKIGKTSVSRFYEKFVKNTGKDPNAKKT